MAAALIDPNHTPTFGGPFALSEKDAVPGRQVWHIPPHASGIDHPDASEGEIVHIGPVYVHVRFRNTPLDDSVACKLNELYWMPDQGVERVDPGTGTVLLEPLPVPVSPILSVYGALALTYEQAFNDSITEFDMAVENLRELLMDRLSPTGAIGVVGALYKQRVEQLKIAAGNVEPIKAAWAAAESRRTRLRDQVAQSLIGPPPNDPDDIPF